MARLLEWPEIKVMGSGEKGIVGNDADTPREIKPNISQGRRRTPKEERSEIGVTIGIGIECISLRKTVVHAV